jgi:hypothetical protein
MSCTFENDFEKDGYKLCSSSNTSDPLKRYVVIVARSVSSEQHRNQVKEHLARLFKPRASLYDLRIENENHHTFVWVCVKESDLN